MRPFDQHGLEYGPRHGAGPCEGIRQGIVGQANLVPCVPRRVHAPHDDGSRCGALRPQRSRPILAERQPRGIGEQHGRACFDRESSPNRKPAVHHVWRLSEGPRLARRDRQGVARGVWACPLAATERQHRSAGDERGLHSRGIHSHAPPPGSAPPRLAFTLHPTDAMKDSMITPPVQVTVFDSAGNVMTSFTGDVTLALGKDPSVPKARLSGRSQAAASAGVATFPDLSIDQIDDGYTLVATMGGGEVSQESTPFNITAVPSPGPGSARTLSFPAQPPTNAAGHPLPPVHGAALDSAGHRVTTFTRPIP